MKLIIKRVFSDYLKKCSEIKMKSMCLSRSVGKIIRQFY
jgi:hypothetical protein